MLAEAQLPARWLYIIAVMLPLTIMVFWYGNRRVQRLLSARNTEPRGRRELSSRARQDPKFAAMVGRMMERGLATPIAEASAEPVLVRGILTTADTTLGGAPGRECVWTNRSGAGRDAAIAVDYVIVADPSGRATIENLALADVVAPEDKSGLRRASCALLLGDEVEVVARFKPERFGEDPDPSRLVYGTLGADGYLHVRVCKRNPVSAPHRDDLASQPASALAFGSTEESLPPSGTTTS